VSFRGDRAHLSAYMHPSLIQEHGIFDAIEKQYLSRFIFAIYLVRSVLNHDVFQCMLF